MPVCKFSAIFIRLYDDTAMWRRRYKADCDFLSAACGDTNGGGQCRNSNATLVRKFQCDFLSTISDA